MADIPDWYAESREALEESGYKSSGGGLYDEAPEDWTREDVVSRGETEGGGNALINAIRGGTEAFQWINPMTMPFQATEEFATHATGNTEGNEFENAKDTVKDLAGGSKKIVDKAKKIYGTFGDAAGTTAQGMKILGGNFKKILLVIVGVILLLIGYGAVSD